MNVLKISAISKQYQTRHIVKNVSLEIHQGEIVGLLGPNGAGKTTSFYIIVGLIKCDTGQIILNGKDITALPTSMRARLGIGYLPQENSIFRKLTVAENIRAILELRKLDADQQHIILEQLLLEFHLHHLRDQLGMSLSGGERRRVEIARTVAMDPKFILLDEPFAGIDPIAVVDIQRIIEHLSKRNIGILITDHNVRETLNICKRAYIVNAGEIMCTGTPEEILHNQRVRDVYLGEKFV